MSIPSDESVMRGFDLQFNQEVAGYRFSLDPFLLCGFASIAAGDRVVDLGTGVGIIPLLLCRRYAPGECVGVELQPEVARLAAENAALNDYAGQIRIVADDLRRHRELFAPQSVDVVVSNPPYRMLGSGKTAPGVERAAARHELAGGLGDFVAAAAYLLKNGGRFYVIYLAERLTDLLTVLREKNLEPKRLRLVQSRVGGEIKLVMVEGRRAGRPGMRVEPPLIVYAGDDYSAEVLACYGEGPG